MSVKAEIKSLVLSLRDKELASIDRTTLQRWQTEIEDMTKLRTRSEKTTAKGGHNHTTKCLTASVTVQPELFSQVREVAVKEGRSFSNMFSVLAKRGLRSVGQT